jgi:hypothetical protein
MGEQGQHRIEVGSVVVEEKHGKSSFPAQPQAGERLSGGKRNIQRLEGDDMVAGGAKLCRPATESISSRT